MAVFEHKGKYIYYQLSLDQSKPILVILNGIMMNVHSWDIFIEELEHDFSVLRFDMYDQGQSTKMNEDYNQDLQVNLLRDLLDYLKISKAHLVGISYGASIALQFAIKYPNYLDRLVVANVVANTNKWLKAIGDGWNEVAKSRNGEAYYNITIPYIYSPHCYESRIEWMENRKQILVPIF
jgi:pimeloyl-ACP methyl ester carboxylesterase